MRHATLLGLLSTALAAHAAHADDASKQKIASAIDAGDAKALRALVGGKIVLEHVWFFDAGCAKKFTATGIKDLSDADLPAFVTCLKGAGIKRVADEIGAYDYEPGARVQIVLFAKPTGKPQLAFAGRMLNGSPYVSPLDMDVHRSGKPIEPDVATKAATAKDPNAVAFAYLKYCVEPNGAVTRAEITSQNKSFPAYGTHALEQVRAWTFKPFMVKTTAVAVCSTTDVKYPPDRKVPIDLLLAPSEPAEGEIADPNDPNAKLPPPPSSQPARPGVTLKPKR